MKLLKMFIFGVGATIFFLGSAFAQGTVTYEVFGNDDKLSGELVITYKKDGTYEAVTPSGEKKFSMKYGGTNLAVVTIDKLEMSMPVEKVYYHERRGQWRKTGIYTNFGYTGEAFTQFFSENNIGRQYVEEFYFRDKLFLRRHLLLDGNLSIVWMKITNQAGERETLRRKAE